MSDSFVDQYNEVTVDLGDPSPKDSQARAAYVARVAGFHHDILKPKLLQMISSLYKILEEPANEHAMDVSIKGTIYALREMIIWGENMTNEHVANQQEPQDN